MMTNPRLVMVNTGVKDPWHSFSDEFCGSSLGTFCVHSCAFWASVHFCAFWASVHTELKVGHTGWWADAFKLLNPASAKTDQESATTPYGYYQGQQYMTFTLLMWMFKTTFKNKDAKIYHFSLPYLLYNARLVCWEKTTAVTRYQSETQHWSLYMQKAPRSIKAFICPPSPRRSKLRLKTQGRQTLQSLVFISFSLSLAPVK